MNAHKIYTRKINGLDNTVWFFMIGIMLLSLFLLTSFLIGRTKCIPFTFAISPKSDSGYYTEKTLSFSLSVSSKSITWDFGDGTPVKTGVYVTHLYHKEGKYYVTASIREDCQETKEIIIKQNPFDHTTWNGIAGPETIPVGKDADFNCLVYGNVWSWQVIDHPEIKPGNEKLGNARFRFTDGGSYTIEVTLDNDRTKSYRKEIFVTDGRVKNVTTTIAPPPVDIKRLVPEEKKTKEKEPIEEPVKAVTNIRYIKEGTFKDYLNQVIADDNFSPLLQDFDQYLFKKGETPVKINGGNQMNFKKFYDYLKDKAKNMTITGVMLQRNQEDKSKVDFIVVTIGSK
jgi:PKD domain